MSSTSPTKIPPIPSTKNTTTLTPKPSVLPSNVDNLETKSTSTPLSRSVPVPSSKTPVIPNLQSKPASSLPPKAAAIESLSLPKNMDVSTTSQPYNIRSSLVSTISNTFSTISSTFSTSSTMQLSATITPNPTLPSSIPTTTLSTTPTTQLSSSQPITIPSTTSTRSVSVPRTRSRSRSDMHVHSDSQVAYHVVKVTKAGDTESTVSCDDGDGSGGIGRGKREGKVQRRTRLSRNKRVSRSFTGAESREEYIRRCSTPTPDGKVLHDKDIAVGAVTCPANSVTAALMLAHQSLKLSCPLLPLELKPPVPAPLVVEDPPSSDNASDLEEDTVRHNLDPVFLNGSSGSFGSAGSGGSTTTGTGSGGGGNGSSAGTNTGSASGSKGARSAPSTPHGVVALGSAGVALAAGAGHEPLSQPNSPSPHQLSHLPRSPSHVFAKYDKGTLKQLSSSAPVMTAQARSPEPPSPKGEKAEKMPAGSSKARQKKFHRHFTQVDDEERVLNYYSCALVGDILLQGHLYITKNYFAFYSNVFGYVTKLLIPISSVLKVSKEKTARIIPNAVGVATAEDKHVFGSLLSRDSTYKLMNMVLRAATNAAAEQTLPPPRDMRPGELDASEFSEDTSSQSGNDDTLRVPRVPRVGVVVGPKIASPEKCKVDTVTTTLPIPDTPTTLPAPKAPMPPLAKYNVFLLVSTLLLLLLFASAGVLLYRISRIQHRYMVGVPGAQDLAYTHPSSQDIYNEILHWQSQLHTKSAGAVHNFLDSNLDQIAKVRKSLEALSTLLMPNTPMGPSSNEPRSETPPEAGTPAPSPS